MTVCSSGTLRSGVSYGRPHFRVPIVSRRSPDNRWIAGGGLNGDLVVWDAASGKEHMRLALRTPLVTVYELAFSPDSKTLAAVMNSAVHVYDVASKKIVYNLRLRWRKPHGIVFSPNGKRLTCAAHRTINLRSPARQACRGRAMVNENWKAPPRIPCGRQLRKSSILFSRWQDSDLQIRVSPLL